MILIVFKNLCVIMLQKDAGFTSTVQHWLNAMGIALGSTTLEAGCITNQIYIVSANLAGTDLYNVFWGGSSIIGPKHELLGSRIFRRYPFTDPRAIQNKMYTATVDLTLAAREKIRAESPDRRSNGL